MFRKEKKKIAQIYQVWENEKDRRGWRRKLWMESVLKKKDEKDKAFFVEVVVVVVCNLEFWRL